MTDALMKGLVGAGLLVQGAAFAVGFFSLGWRWPIAAATAVVAIGILVVQAIDGRIDDGLTRGIALFAVLGIASGVASACTLHPAAAWAARVFFGLEFLGQLALLLFLLLFKITRLW